jgi:quinol-cytochrome oxidoreductase complex cytochrome b subunit
MVKDFIKHLFPRVVLKKNLRLSYTFCLGGMALTVLLALLGSGFLLLFHYQPSPEHAFESILKLETQIPGGLYLRRLHHLASYAYLVLLFLHTLRVVLTGAYRRPREFNWIIGCALLFLSLFAGYTGYLLPMDQLAYWATQTGMNLLQELPLIGSGLHAFLVPDSVGATYSLMRFYVLHILVIPSAMAILVSLHFYRIRQDKGVLPYL